MSDFDFEAAEHPVVVQEAIRMTQNAPLSQELAKEDSQRVCGASLAEITTAAAILTLAHGIDPKSTVGEMHMRIIRTSLICGARTAQRLNGQDVL